MGLPVATARTASGAGRLFVKQPYGRACGPHVAPGVERRGTLCRPCHRADDLRLPVRHALAPGFDHEAGDGRHGLVGARGGQGVPHRGVVHGPYRARHPARRPLRGGRLRPRVHRGRPSDVGRQRVPPALLGAVGARLRRRLGQGLALLGQRLAVGRQSIGLPALPLAAYAREGDGACAGFAGQACGRTGNGDVHARVGLLPHRQPHPYQHALGRSLPGHPRLDAQQQ